MLNRFLLSIFLIGQFVATQAQTTITRFQFIHNSPSPTIDVYIDKGRILNDFEFGKATPYTGVVSNKLVTIGIAPANSDSSGQALFKIPFTFDNARTHMVTAAGVVFSDRRPFTLFHNTNARERALNGAKVDFTVFHGGLDVQPVDIFLHKTTTKLVSNLAYGQYSTYTSVDPGVYFVDVKVAGKDSTINTYKVDLTAQTGRALCLVAGGALSGAPVAFNINMVDGDGKVTPVPAELPPPPPSARLQIIHNSSNAGLVDVYVDNQRVADDLDFRRATAFLTIPITGTPARIAIAPGTSTAPTQATLQVTQLFEDKKVYTLAVAGQAGNTTRPVALFLNTTSQNAAGAPWQTDIGLFQGAVTIARADVDELLIDTLARNVAYGRFARYKSFLPEVYDFTLKNTGDTTVLGSYRFDARTLAGQAVQLFTSTQGTTTGLYAAYVDGRVVALSATPTVRCQVIHNAPDPTVDIYAGRVRIVNDLEFRKATRFLTLPADRVLPLGIATANSTSSMDVIFKSPLLLVAGKTHTIFAIGIPFSDARPIGLVSDDRAQETTTAGNVALSVFNGAINISNLRVSERVAGTWFDDIAYSTASTSRTVRATEYYLDVRPTTPATVPLTGTYRADLTAFGGQAVRIFASGRVGGTPDFGMYAALADGRVFPLPAAAVARVQLIHNSPSASVDVYVDTVRLLRNFTFRRATPFFYAPAGDSLRIRIAPANSNSVRDAFALFSVRFDNSKTYVVAVNGPQNALRLAINDRAQERPQGTGANMELSFMHGSPGTPPISLVEFGGRTPFLSNIVYNNYTNYIAFPPNIIILDVAPASNFNTFIGTFGGDFGNFAGATGIVFASGIPDGNPDFGLFWALPNGNVIRIPAYARLQIVHNAPANPRVDVYVDRQPYLNNAAFRTATDVGLIPAGVRTSIGVAPDTSTSAASIFYSNDFLVKTGRTYLAVAGGVQGNTTTPFQLFVNEMGRDRSFTGAGVDLTLFHGVPDAPPVDILRDRQTPPLFDNAAYGTFTPYTNVPVNNYTLQVTPADNNASVLAQYRADLSDRGREAILLFASGFLNPAAGQPGFQVWAALENGTTFPLPLLISTNEPSDIQALALMPNPVQTVLQVRCTTDDVNADVQYRIFDTAGRLVQQIKSTGTTQNIEISTLPSGLYRLEARTKRGIKTAAFVKL
jgi:Domain of unknown function (DUF4397)/Secretion system C-terminal sorting domain